MELTTAPTRNKEREETTMKYNFKQVEPKWQEKWESAKVFHAEDVSDKPKY